MDQSTADLRENLARLSQPTIVAAGLPVTRCGREPGTAPAVVLIHGLGASRETWAGVLSPLTARFDVIALDLPGHGQSPRRTHEDPAEPHRLAIAVTRACHELGLVRPHLVGNSLGGWIALEMAADGEAASVTALAPAGLRERTGPVHPMLRFNRLMAWATGPVSDAILTLAPIRALAFASGSVKPGQLDVHLARSAARAMRISTGYGSMLEAAAANTFTRTAQIAVPISVIFGDHDAILPGPQNQRRHLAPEQARWETWAQCGHAPMWDQPQRTIDLITDTVAAAEIGQHR